MPYVQLCKHHYGNYVAASCDPIDRRLRVYMKEQTVPLYSVNYSIGSSCGDGDHVDGGGSDDPAAVCGGGGGTRRRRFAARGVSPGGRAFS